MFKTIIQLFVAIAFAILSAYFAAWLFPRLYATYMGVPLDTLSDDYRMGFYGIIIEAGVFFLMASGSFLFLLHRNKRKNID